MDGSRDTWVFSEVLWQARVLGTPAPQGSKRHVGRGILVESSKLVKPYRESIVAACEGAPTFARGVPVAVYLQFGFQRPKGHFGTGRNSGSLKRFAPTFHTSRPDTDKLSRSVLDALSAAGVLWDDSQVALLDACKVWSDSAESFTQITVRGLEQ